VISPIRRFLSETYVDTPVLLEVIEGNLCERVERVTNSGIGDHLSLSAHHSVCIDLTVTTDTDNIDVLYAMFSLCLLNSLAD
jgi:hypothetical protein